MPTGAANEPIAPSFTRILTTIHTKYAAADKSECIGMVTTGGPASYVELLSCVEILRDARNIRNTDALESDDSAISSRRRRRK
jgi:hypothetical protein